MQNVTVFGGDGFVGRYVVEQLLRGGARVRIASRNPKRGWHLKSQADLGQISWIAADITRPETLCRAVAGADAVVNLVGAFDNVDAVQHIGAANVAEAARKAKVKALVHISAIGADVESASRYGQSKGEGEDAVRKAFPKAVILRPSLIFGREDQFTNRFAALIRMLPVLPVIRGVAKFQPVFVGDVARAVAGVLADAGAHAGKTYALGGPREMSMSDINAYLMEETGRPRFTLDVPDFMAAGMARVTGWLPLAPMTWDQWLMLQSDNVVGDQTDGLAALGITPTPMEAVAPDWLITYRRHGRFGAKAHG